MKIKYSYPANIKINNNYALILYLNDLLLKLKIKKHLKLFPT